MIVYAGWNDYGYGNMIMIDHGNGWQSLYAHLSQITAGCGTGVTQGQSIGLMGSTGNSTGPHLHWGVKLNGARVNPYALLDLPFKNGSAPTATVVTPVAESSSATQLIPESIPAKQ